MNLEQFLTILKFRYKLIFKVFAGFVILVTIFSLVWPNTYTGIATVVIDAKAPDAVTGMLTQGMIMPSYLATQVDVISSERVARGVVKKLGLEKDPELVSDWKDDTNNGADGSFESYYAFKLGKKLKVEPSRESNVIEIRFKAKTAKTAAAVANAFAEVYLDTNLELMNEPATRYSNWFTNQVKQIRGKMAKEQESFTLYQKDKGIVSMDEKFDVEAAHMSDLSAQLTVLLAQLADARTREREATSGKLETIPEVLNNLEIQNLRTAIASADGKVLSASNTLGPNHPQVREQKAELEALKLQLKSEMGNVADSLRTNTIVAQQKVDRMQQQVEAQRARMLDLKNQRDEAANLQTDLVATQLDYNTIRQRLTQSNLQSQSPQTDVSILTPAYEPIEPSFPKLGLNILASIFLGLILGVSAAIFKENREKLIRSAEDVSEHGFTLLGVLVEKREVAFRKYWWQFWLNKKKLSF